MTGFGVTFLQKRAAFQILGTRLSCGGIWDHGVPGVRLPLWPGKAVLLDPWPHCAGMSCQTQGRGLMSSQDETSLLDVMLRDS